MKVLVGKYNNNNKKNHKGFALYIVVKFIRLYRGECHNLFRVRCAYRKNVEIIFWVDIELFVIEFKSNFKLIKVYGLPFLYIVSCKFINFSYLYPKNVNFI